MIRRQRKRPLRNFFNRNAVGNESALPPSGSEKPDTWKLVGARCEELADCVLQSRTPFLLAITWAFVLASALTATVNPELSNVHKSIIRAETCNTTGTCGTHAPDASGVVGKGFWDSCKKIIGIEIDASKVGLTYCVEALKRRRDALEKDVSVSLPGFSGLNGRLVGTIGLMGLFGILLWEFYAFRRENHAIRAFIDLKRSTWRPWHWAIWPRRVILCATDRHFAAAHVAYAYVAVAQKFLFLISTRQSPRGWVKFGLIRMLIVRLLPRHEIVNSALRKTRPDRMARAALRWLALGLVLFPLGIAASQVQLLPRLLRLVALPIKDWPGVVYRIGFEDWLFVVICLMGILCWLVAVHSSRLLNAWYLAEDVWMNRWDGPISRTACAIEVDRTKQTARESEDG
jgi:hypothetical protein